MPAGSPELPLEFLDDLVVPLVGADQPVALPGDGQVRVGVGARADQVRGVQQAHDRGELLGEPAPGHLGPVVELVLVLHEPETPGLHGLAEFRVAPGIGERDLGVGLGRKLDPRPEQPLVALVQQVPAAADAPGGHGGEDLRHVGVDRLLPHGQRDRDPVMPVEHEVQVADAVHVDGRDRLTAALGQGQPLPALPDPARGGPEPAVEVPGGVHGAHHGVQLDHLQAQLALAGHPERGDDLVERQDEVDVVRFPAQPLRQPGQHLPPPGTLEVVLHVGPGEPRVSGHRGRHHRCHQHRGGRAGWNQPGCSRPGCTRPGCGQHCGGQRCGGQHCGARSRR